ncbi:hypothetical protein H9Q09_20920 [Aurantimonas sp. DM33-3]|uniref:hypothetical protein n=1 Tax=Aurantimonas sp. DM33-3 TaxID=2766955 RepID=UPI0016527C2C|nr:hypothetical protein [Aurantimonas sp. DM33-3]MBC6718651.1 hypothetical protein [Aurantimonas sp. DM33-3]
MQLYSNDFTSATEKIGLRYATMMYIVSSTDGCGLHQLRKVIIGLRVEWPVSAPADALMMSHWQGVVSALEYGGMA